MDNPVVLIVALFLTFTVGGVLGAAIAYLYAKAQASRLEAEHAADLEKLDWVRNAQRALEDTFEALASKSLRLNAKDFSGRIHQQLTSHAGHLGLLKSSLENNITKIDRSIRDLESKREAAYSGASCLVGDGVATSSGPLVLDSRWEKQRRASDSLRTLGIDRLRRA